MRQGEENLKQSDKDNFIGPSDDKTIAVNWWYDMESRGMGWAWYAFFRGSDAPDGN